MHTGQDAKQLHEIFHVDQLSTALFLSGVVLTNNQILLPTPHPLPGSSSQNEFYIEGPDSLSYLTDAYNTDHG
jgi:hypothetical protein